MSPPRNVFTVSARRVWLLACAGATIDAIHAGTGAGFGLPPPVVWTTWIDVAVLGCCGLAALVAAGSGDGARGPRLLLGVGILVYAPGQAVYTLIVAHQSSITFPMFADYSWLAFYPFALGAANPHRSRRHGRGAPRDVRLDAAVGALTVLTVGSMLVIPIAGFFSGVAHVKYTGSPARTMPSRSTAP